MKPTKLLMLVSLFVLFNSCFKDQDDYSTPYQSRNILDFVWKGMNATYLYKSKIPDLANNRFTNREDYTTFLKSHDTPEQLFENLIYQRKTVDRFSVFVNDYIAWEQRLNGISESNGLEFNFYNEPGNNNNVFAIVRMVLNNSEASKLGIQRGQIVHAVNNTKITRDNIKTLFNQKSYTLHFAHYNDQGTQDNSDDTIEPNNTSVLISKAPYSENPVYLSKTFTINNENVGYLVYNQFTPKYNDALNQVFGQFKAKQIRHLILDLRYNPGGAISSAALLGSLATGQFNGKVFSKLQFNKDLQNLNTDYKFIDNYNNSNLNSLNLKKIYVLTSNATASASEMIINSLSAYIQVVQIGGITTGKSQASITVYDSPDFTKNGVNPTHTYAMQPLVAISVNANEGQVSPNGLIPTITVNEAPTNYGILGSKTEPLLSVALAAIESNLGRTHNFKHNSKTTGLTPLKTDLLLDPFGDNMYIDFKLD